MIQLKIHSPAEVVEGKSYLVRLTVTNQSTKAGLPVEAVLGVGISATTPWEILISAQESDEYFGPNETRSFDYSMTIPVGTGGQVGLLTAWVDDPTGIAIASATEDVVITPTRGIFILNITGEKRADGSIMAHIYWTYYGISIDPEAFASVVTSIGRMENGVWKNYYTVETFPGIPPEGGTGVVGAYWAPEAVAQMPKGPAGFRASITIYLYWQPQAWSAPFIAEDVVVI